MWGYYEYHSSQLTHTYSINFNHFKSIETISMSPPMVYLSECSTCTWEERVLYLLVIVFKGWQPGQGGWWWLDLPDHYGVLSVLVLAFGLWVLSVSEREEFKVSSCDGASDRVPFSSARFCVTGCCAQKNWHLWPSCYALKGQSTRPALGWMLGLPITTITAHCGGPPDQSPKHPEPLVSFLGWEHSHV